MKYQLAQLNIARMLAPLDSPVMAGFVQSIDSINQLAETSDGFIWRLKDDSGDATSIRVFDDDFLIVNMSVWENLDCLTQFVYFSKHVDIYKRRKEWFEKMKEMYMVLWYVQEAHEPTPEEGREKLMHLRSYGETPEAFSFKKSFPAPEM